VTARSRGRRTIGDPPTPAPETPAVDRVSDHMCNNHSDRPAVLKVSEKWLHEDQYFCNKCIPPQYRRRRVGR
jgi:hypothetical protein